MSKSITIVSKGLREVIRNLKEFPEEARKEIDLEMAAAANEVRNGAIRKVPVDEAGIKQSIALAKVGGNYEVSVGKSYAPYVEFGTKKRFKPTRGFETYAQQFKGKSVAASAGSLEDAILGWVKRKKIKFEKEGKSKAGKSRYLTAEQTAFIIARFISFHGVKAHPFLFPEFARVRREVTQRLVEAIRRAFR